MMSFRVYRGFKVSLDVSILGFEFKEIIIERGLEFYVIRWICIVQGFSLNSFLVIKNSGFFVLKRI